MQQRFDTWQRGLRRAGCRIFAAFCSVVALLQLRSLLAGESVGVGRASALAGVVLLLAAVVRGILGLTNTRDALAFTVLLVVSTVDPASLANGAATGGDANPSFFMLAATFLAYIVAWQGPVVPAAMIVAAGAYGVSSVVLGGRGLDPVLDETILLVTSDLAIWMLFRELQAESRRADDAHYQAIFEQGLAARATTAQRLAIAAQRTLHDRVLTALLSIVNGPTDGEGRRTLRQVCRQAAEAIHGLVADPGGSQATSDVALHHRLQTETSAAAPSVGVKAWVRHERSAEPVPIPGYVAEAFSGAVGEALRNVGRHAGVDHADVVLTTGPKGGMRLEVIDHGRGVSPESAAGFGLRHSVLTRMREVGGDASVEARRGGGTRVVLTWAAQSDSVPTVARSVEEPAELTRVSRHPRGVAAEFSLPLFVGAAYLAVRYPFDGRPDWTNAVVYLGVVVCAALCIAAIPRPRALRLVHAVMFGILPGLLGTGLFLAGSGSLLGFEAWVVGLASFPLLVLAMARPHVPVLLLAGSQSAVVLTAAVIDPAVTPLDVLAPITQTPMFVGLLVYGVAAVRRVRSNAEADEQTRAEAAASSEAAEVRQHVIETHYDWLLSDVRPFLDGVASGKLEPTDASVRGQASVMALAIRDELALPAQISGEVRTLIATARGRGIRVRTRASDEWSVVPPELARILAYLVEKDEITDITVSLPLEATPYLRVVVRPRLHPTRRRALLQLLSSGRLDISEDDLVSIITFTAAPRSET